MATMNREARAYLRSRLAELSAELRKYEEVRNENEYYEETANYLRDVVLFLRSECNEVLTPSSDVVTDDGIWEQYFVS